MTTKPGARPDSEAPTTTSTSMSACGDCGQHALEEDTPHEFARGLSDRLICRECGAHRVLAA
ncbi:hypothetical protein FHX42_003857 [Saccharopolyspora lacisalsi]|uniref:Uncharacterized protein n=1 Tax=Halosaccharopolyspora lacisalsi TaxID=1000566 RepID=A0A839E575_9PSEU|nr:hypothetical protein [Halosaccharopolyspora lacisalsi]MBA8826481.1 hypothetical protein [Halosaccharopolyspora lacisalsi]